MTDRMRLFHNPQSRAIIAHWMLEEVGAAYDLVPVAFEESGERDPELLAVNPMGKVPTLVLADGTVVTETPAICAHLADAFPETGLAPAPGTPERARYYRWLFFAGSCAEPAIIVKTMAGGETVPKMSAGWSSYDDVVDTLEGHLGAHDFVTGGSFTAADLYLASVLWWGGMVEAPRLRESSPIQAFVERAMDRPAFKRAMGG